MLGNFHFRVVVISLGVLMGLFAFRTMAGNGERAFRRISFVNANTGKKATVQLVTRFGTINNRSRQRLSQLSSSGDKNARTAMLHPRLFLMLQRVADQFPGKTIEIVSAHRFGEGVYSDNHTMGRAVDFRVQGVNSEKVYEFIKTLPKCGTGHYPKAKFVHLDVREKAQTWIDHFHTNADCQVGATEGATSSGREIEFYSVPLDETRHLQLVSESGVINNRSRQIISEMSSSRVKSARTALFHPRLILMLQKFADEFPGKRIELISGYRIGKKGFHSYHNYGRALDFRMSGVDNKKLYEFALTLPKCGVGYYPNSVFIHFDVRDKSATWIDYSGVGEPSEYKKPN